jgi:hypothetical protein
MNIPMLFLLGKIAPVILTTNCWVWSVLTPHLCCCCCIDHKRYDSLNGSNQCSQQSNPSFLRLGLAWLPTREVGLGQTVGSWQLLPDAETTHWKVQNVLIDNIVEIVMLEKLDCIPSKRATRPIYMKVQVRLNAISPYQSQQSSPAISGHTRHLRLRPYKTPPSPAIRDSSPAETCICNKYNLRSFGESSSIHSSELQDTRKVPVGTLMIM